MKPFAIAIHGGAGTILPSQMTPELEQAYKTALHEALTAGHYILMGGGSSIDAVEAAVVALENCPLFNAGKGSVFNAMGHHEMDAAIMDGKTLDAGAITSVRHIKNPVSLAKMVMQQSEHVMLCGDGAEQFARQHHITFEDDAYFYVQHRYDQWQALKGSDTFSMDHIAEQGEKKFGTVGAVALDMAGNLAAATSTGGMTNKKFGRIGDSPIIGAGTYANNQTCAISCTGHGELFIRSVVAHDISCLMAYKDLSLQEACDIVVMHKLVTIGGEGGLVAIDHRGNIAMPFNSEGMYRGTIDTAGNESIGIYR